MATRDLKTVPTAELRAELDRRAGKAPANADYYFWVYDDEDRGDGRPLVAVLVVHKRYWHVNHCVADWGISGRLELPREGISECQESMFEVVAADPAAAVEKMLALGFAVPPGAAPGGPPPKENCVRRVAIGKRTVLWANCTADAAEVRDAFALWSDANPKFDSAEDYKAGLRAMAAAGGLVVAVTSDTPGYLYFALIDRALFDSLPPEPDPEADDDADADAD